MLILLPLKNSDDSGIPPPMKVQLRAILLNVQKSPTKLKQIDKEPLGADGSKWLKQAWIPVYVQNQE